MTNQDFFRQNAPTGSVARLPNGEMGRVSPRSLTQTSLKSLRASPGKRSGTLDAMSRGVFEGSMYATPFVLDKDKNNRHRVEDGVKKTMPENVEIPFLRS